MNIKKNDNVIMLSGKDKGKAGKVMFVFPKKSNFAGDKIVVEGLNMAARHLRPKKQGQKGQIVHKERAVDASNVMLVCKNCGKPSRVGTKTEGEKKVRVCKKCRAEI